MPCTPLGCLEMLRRSGVDVRGSHAVIVGDSNIVGTPLSMLLRDAGAAAVTVCHRVSTPAQPIEGFHAQEAERREPQGLQEPPSEAERRAQAGVCLPRTPGPRLAPRLHGSPRAVPRPAAAGLAGDTDYPSIAMAAPRKKHDMEDAGTSRAGFARDLPRITAQVTSAAAGCLCADVNNGLSLRGLSIRVTPCHRFCAAGHRRRTSSWLRSGSPSWCGATGSSRGRWCWMWASTWCPRKRRGGRPSR